MRISPQAVMRLLGVPETGRHVYPVAVDCPICRGRGKLEVRSPAHVVCRACHFTGDLIRLLAESRGEEPSATIHELKSLSLLDQYDGDVLQGRTRQQDLKELVLERTQAVKDSGFAPSAIAVFDRLNCHYNQRILQTLVPHVIPLGRQEFLDRCFDGHAKNLPKASQKAFTWWGLRTALAIPSWQSVDIVGLWIVTIRGVQYLHMTDSQTYGVGFAHVPSFTDRRVVVVDNIEHALRFMAWSAADRGEPIGMVVPYGVHTRVEHCQAGRTVFWTPSGDSAHYLKALDVMGAQTMDHQAAGRFNPDRELPCGGSIGQFERLLDEALPAHQAAALQLQRMSMNGARALIAGFNVAPASQARIVSYASGDDARYVASLFENTASDPTIHWDGQTITDTSEGWVADQRVISSARFYIEKIRPKGKTGEGVCEGTVAFTSRAGERYNLPFRENLTTLRKKAADWLQRLVIAETGHMPYVDSRWSRKLVEISQQFHQPTPVMTDQNYGWEDRVLRMPRFMVDAKGISPTKSMVSGPAIPVPEPLSAVEQEAFAQRSFCRLFLALSGNLIRTVSGLPGIGLMLTQEPHVVSRLANAFGTQISVSPTPEQVEQAAECPLPLFTDWSPVNLRQMFERTSGFRNIVLSVDSHTARLATVSTDWLQLRVGPHVDYQALRAVFLYLPHLLRHTDLAVDSDTFYRDLADLVVQDIRRECRSHQLSSAAAELDQHAVYRSGTAATRILELIFWAIERGDIEPEYFDECVFIPYLDFANATYSDILSLPNEWELTQRLHQARYILTKEEARVMRRNGWLFNRTVWDVHASLMQSRAAATE